MKPIKNKFIIIAVLGCLHFLLTVFVVFHAYPLVFESSFPDAESIEAAQFWAGLWDAVVAPLGWLEVPLKSTPLANYTRWLSVLNSFFWGVIFYYGYQSVRKGLRYFIHKV
jgi:hypothetical protein